MLGLILLTFRELWAKKITLAAFLVSTLIWVMMAFALNLDVVDGGLTGLRIFGQNTGVENAEGLNPISALTQFVIGTQTFVAGAAYWLGTLLALFATVPLWTNLLEPGRIELILSKPLARWQVLAAHLAGVLLAVLLLTGYLLGMTWLVISVKTTVWHARFLLAIPIVTLMFGVMYSIALLLGTLVRSTALALITTYGLLFASIVLGFKDELAEQIALPWRHMYNGLYHALPHFSEVTASVAQLVGGDPVATWYPLWGSLLIGCALLALAAFRFQRADF